ncbi:formylglycine-generating enzyme family protein [Acaryochloris sp. IP29b_bin.137]|uniref:formylglycine-generating enzyme family protein n=1 Tax=Acaryochloris sp. IP29b_bin.137 TaxID=2969217 RepID=UPI00260C567A|nr:formylglycine-generating enzyme family protein [Acaryochloris sp. IP29b_bin.137]
MSKPITTTRRRFLTLLKYAGFGTFGSIIAHSLYQCDDIHIRLLPTDKIFTVDAQGRIIHRRSLPQLQILKEKLGKNITLEMVSIPGGTFTMGSPSHELERWDGEGPQHKVNVPSFYLGKYPVTQVQWKAIMRTNPSNTKGANRPVERVSWNKATEFCQKLSQKTGKLYRLPSEAEWEYACRAGTTTPFHFGETITLNLANYYPSKGYASGPIGNSLKRTTDVGKYPPNAFGLYDMHGNVTEWCQDTLHKNYEGAPTDGSAWEDNYYEERMKRGGSWGVDPGQCRSAKRSWLIPYNSEYTTIGFRVALDTASNL